MRLARVAAFPERLLLDDEEVVLDMRTHAKAVVVPALVLMATIGAASYLATIVPPGDAQRWLRLALLVLVLLVVLRYTLLPYLRWLTTTITVTDRRLVVRAGVLSRQTWDVPLGQVNELHVSHSLLERMFGCGTIVVDTGGEWGELEIADVPRVWLVQRELYRLVDDNELEGEDDDEFEDEPAP